MASTMPGRWWVILISRLVDVSHAFITGPNGMGMRDVGTLRVVITALLVASTTQDRWWVGLKAKVLPTLSLQALMGRVQESLGTLGETGLALGINDAGQVVGWSIFSSGSSQHAFVTGANEKA